jgi:Hg(II)-responsive transcriptional regulator
MSAWALKIGEVAARASVNVQTLRYYERRGLLPRPPRSESNYRLYSDDTVRRVRFVKRAQELGFSLGEIRGLLDLRVGPRATCADVRRRTQAKIAEIEEKIWTLRSMKRVLDSLAATCSGRGPVAECPILDSLDEEPDS